MSEVEYDAARAALRATYGETSVEANAKRDQALARLFAHSNWTQEELAKKEGKSQSWIQYRLRFGRFLDFTTMVVKAENVPNNLTERRFRQFWEQTDASGSKEEFRFRQIVKALHGAHVTSPRRPAIGAKIRERFADGKWHSLEVIAEKIEANIDHVRETLASISKNQNYGCKAEKKPSGKSTSYRIFKLDRAISSAELLEKLAPIIKALEEQGRQNVATMSPPTVAILAGKLRKMLGEWTE
jgi:transcriptional regulator with XRE-family HTH domain